MIHCVSMYHASSYGDIMEWRRITRPPKSKQSEIEKLAEILFWCWLCLLLVGYKRWLIYLKWVHHNTRQLIRFGSLSVYVVNLVQSSSSIQGGIRCFCCFETQATLFSLPLYSLFPSPLSDFYIESRTVSRRDSALLDFGLVIEDT